jgi:glucokinase
MEPRKRKPKNTEIILVGDIGGTKTRLGLYRVTDDKRYRLMRGKIFPSKKYEGLEIILQEFLGREKNIDCACFGVAGPILKGRVKLTNLPWVIDTKALQKEFRLRKVVVINDLVANAYGISMLKKNGFVTLNVGKKRKGNAALISAGTGLGEAILFWNGKKHIPSPSEGGHVEFGPRDSLEIKLLRYLFDRFGHVSYERILSGEGLFHIYQFLRDDHRGGREPRWLTKQMKQKDPAAVISEMALLKKDNSCMRALDLFVSIYGAEAGNLALKTMAIGGIYVGGGIAPKIIRRLKRGSFMDAFRDKGRFSEMMADIPVKVILNDKTALLGGVSYALGCLSGS